MTSGHEGLTKDEMSDKIKCLRFEGKPSSGLSSPRAHKRFSVKQYDKLVKLQLSIQLWAATPGNLSSDQYWRFFDAVRLRRYEDAYGVLIEAFEKQTITIWHRRRWTKWFEATQKGFDPQLINES